MALVYIQHCQLCKVAWMKYKTAVTTQKSEVRIKINHPHYKAAQACLLFKVYFVSTYFHAVTTIKKIYFSKICIPLNHTIKCKILDDIYVL